MYPGYFLMDNHEMGETTLQYRRKTSSIFSSYHFVSGREPGFMENLVEQEGGGGSYTPRSE